MGNTINLNKSRGITLSYGTIRIASLIYALLPVVIFFIGYLRWYYALIGTVAVGVSIYKVIRSRKINTMCNEVIHIGVFPMVVLFYAILLWAHLGGLNGCWYQTSDWDCRNAIFRDLITHDWPVIYESSGSALVYYIGHWLPAAVVGKVVGGLLDSARFAWLFGRMALWVWTSLGLFLIVLLLFIYTKANTIRERIVVFLVMVFFSGMDYFGAVIRDEIGYLMENLHLEWWSTSELQYTSITACLYWVFNQSIVPWLMTLCFLLDKDERNYVVYGVCCLICGPLPLVGLVILMFSRALYRFVICIRKRQFWAWVKCIFSAENFAGLICMPLIAVYILSNNAVAATGDSTRVQEQALFFSSGYWNKDLLLFYMLEVGFYLIFLWNNQKKNPLYYTIAISLLCIPYFHVGLSNDFCMRASLPAVFIILAYVAEYLVAYFPGFRKVMNKKMMAKQVCAILLAIVFLCGAITPIVEIYRGIYYVNKMGTFRLSCDTIGTFDDGTVSINFSTANAKEKIFFKYFAK